MKITPILLDRIFSARPFVHREKTAKREGCFLIVAQAIGADKGKAGGIGRIFLVRMEKSGGEKGQRICLPLQGFSRKRNGTCTAGKGRVKFRKGKEKAQGFFPSDSFAASL